MSYEFLIILPTVALGVLCAIASLFCRSRLRVLLALFAVASSVIPSWWGDAQVGCSLGLGPDQWRCGQLKAQWARSTGVDARILQAAIVEDAAAGANAYLPWTLVPLVLGALASVRARGGWTVWVLIGAAAVLALPLVVAAARPSLEHVIPLGDPRWTIERAGQDLERARAPQADPREPGALMQTLESSCFALRGLAADGAVAVPPRVQEGCSVEALFDAIEHRVQRLGHTTDGCTAFERLKSRPDAGVAALRAQLVARFTEFERACGRAAGDGDAPPTPR